MKIYIVLSNGYEDGESAVEGVYKHADDARAHVKDLRRNTDPMDAEWLYFTIQDAEVREDY
jgi:hypothetical protein